MCAAFVTTSLLEYILNKQIVECDVSHLTIRCLEAMKCLISGSCMTVCCFLPIQTKIVFCFADRASQHNLCN